MVAPIKGMIVRRLYKDLAIGLGAGTLGGLYFWHGIHLPIMKKRDAYYAKLDGVKI